MAKEKGTTLPTVAQLVAKVVSEFKKDPRNKVFVAWELLLASAREERGEPVEGDVLRDALARFSSGDAEGDDQDLYDAATAVCGEVARACFASSPDEDVDYTTTLLETDDGFIAELRA